MALLGRDGVRSCLQTGTLVTSFRSLNNSFFFFFLYIFFQPLPSLLQEVPTTASSYVDSALKPFRQLQSGHKDKLRQAVIRQWLEGALSESTHK